MISPVSSTASVLLELTCKRNGVAASGLSPTVAVRLNDSSSFFDWADSTFKTSGWTLKNAPMVEVDGGRYVHAFSASSVPSGDCFLAEYSATYPSGKTSIATDAFLVVEDLEPTIAGVALLTKHLRGKLEPDVDDPSILRLYDPDNDALLLTWTFTDNNGDPVVAVAGSPAARTKAT